MPGDAARDPELLAERLDDITRLVSDWIWETDPELRFGFLSPRVGEALGYHPRELLGTPLLDLVRFDEPPPFAAVRAPFRDVSATVVHKNGELRRFLVSGLPVFSRRNGEFAGFRGTARDVTAELEARQGLARSQTRLTEAIESVSEGFALFDPQDRLVICNERFRSMWPNVPIELGDTFETMLHRALALGNLDTYGRPAEEWMADRLANRLTDMLELRITDGRWLKCGDRRTADGSIVCVRTDITELKQREHALIAAKELAEVASRTKSEFLANISHELRTPLNAIIGFSEIMRDEVFGPLGNAQYREYLGDVLESAHHLLEVINDILDLAKAEAGKLELAETETDIAAIVRGASRLMRERAHRAAVTLDQFVEDDLPAVYGDERKLKQILLNLLANAVKFTPSGGQIEVSARRNAAGDLLLAVSDTGIGIAPEHLATALAPFGQVESSLSRRHDGTGLGLPLSRAMAELHGGTLAIESVVGEGTKVTVRLPASRFVKSTDANAAA